MTATFSRLLPTRRSAAAAGRLAAIYGVGVAATWSALVLYTGEWVANVFLVALLDAFAAVFFGGAAWLALLVARQYGFVLLWLALSAWWLSYPHIQYPPDVVLALFVHWSVPALPLYLVSVFVPHLETAASGWRGLPIIGATWTALVATAIAVTPAHYFMLTVAVCGLFPEPPAAVLRVARYVWGPAPLLIAAVACSRVLRMPSTLGAARLR